MREEYEWYPASEPSWGVGSVLNALDWDHVRVEVEQEIQARIAIVGLRGVGKSSLLNHLRGWEVSPTGDRGGEGPLTHEDLGLFVLVDLPDQGRQRIMCSPWTSSMAAARSPGRPWPRLI